ncbi:hypothetical protein MTP99_007407 [Tenebrio molitor]|nr:hypothetical protein MTP99_007407 [Tenebrio molitor]
MKFVLLLALTVAAVCIHEATGARFQNHKRTGDGEKEQDGLEGKTEKPKPHKFQMGTMHPFSKRGKHGKHGPKNPHQKPQKERKHKESESSESSESDE